MKHGWKRNSSSSTLFIELHWYVPHFTLSSRQTCSFPLQNKIVPLTSKNYKKIPGKKPLLSSTFLYLNYSYRAFRFPLDAWSFSFLNASHSHILSVWNHEPLGNWSVLGSRLYGSGFRPPLPSFQSHFLQMGPSFLCTSVDWPLSSKLPAINRQASFKTANINN